MSAATFIPHDIEPHPLTRMYNGKFGIWLFLASEVMLFGALFSAYVLLRVGASPGTWPMYGSANVHGHEILSVWMATLNTAVLITSSVTMVLSWAALKMGNFGKARLLLLVTFLLAGCFLVVKYFEYQSKLTHTHIVFKDAPGDDLKEVVSHTVVQTAVGPRDLYFMNGHVTEDVAANDFIMIAPDPRKESLGGAGHGKDEHGHDAKAAEHDAHAEGHHEAIKIDRSLIRRYSVWGPRASTFLAIYFTITGLHGLHIVGGMVVILYLIITGERLWKRQPEKLINRVECTGLYWHFVDLVWIFLFPVLYLL